MKSINGTLFCMVYPGQQADSTAGAQRPMCGGCSYHPLNDILPPPAENMIDDIGAESDDDGGTCRPNPKSFLMVKTGFQKFEGKLQTRTIRQQQYLEVIRNRALGLCADYEQRLVADEDVAWLREHDYIVNPPTAGSLANRSVPAATQLQISRCED